MAINSRAKGARGEREARDLFVAHGFPARRGQQFAGGTDSPDIIVPDFPDYHFEIKLVQALNLHEAMNQAKRDGGDAKVPVVLHKKNGTGWLATFDIEDFFEILIKEHDEKQNKYCNCSHTQVPKEPAAADSV